MAQIKSNISQIPGTITEIDNTDGNNIYLGVAKAGTALSAADWQIRKVTTSGGNISILYASGTIAFDKVWNNRASYSYS